MTAKNIQSVRQRLREWFESLVRIDAWDADPPRTLFADGSTEALPLPACTAIEYPVKDLEFTRDGPDAIYGSGTFTFALVYRYHKQYKLDDLPVRRVEGVSQYLMCNALLGLGGCGGIREAHPMLEEFPVVVARDGTDQDDWLVSAHVVLSVQFTVTDFGLSPEFLPVGFVPDGDLALDELSIRTYRAEIGALDNNTLDADLTVSAST